MVSEAIISEDALYNDKKKIITGLRGCHQLSLKPKKSRGQDGIMFLMHSQKNSFTPPHIWRAEKTFAMLVTLVSSYARAQEKELSRTVAENWVSKQSWLF